VPIPSDCPPRRVFSPIGVARRLALGLALLLWAGWAPPAAAERWVRPVPGAATREFSLGADPFARGQHRGVDLAADFGARVRSACSGVVVFAGVLPELGRVVSVRCGRWRVSYLPLAVTLVPRGSMVAAQTSLGTVGVGHEGLHVGVRREGRRFGYVDPLARFGADPPPPVALRPPGLGRAPRASQPRPLPFSRPTPVPARQASADAPSLAPWPVWLGLALFLTGAAGSRTIARGRVRRRAPMAASRPSLR